MGVQHRAAVDEITRLKVEIKTTSIHLQMKSKRVEGIQDCQADRKARQTEADYELCRVRQRGQRE